VNCLECHAPPGPAGYAKIVTNGSGNVLAQMRGDFILPEGTAIDDASCLACHQRELRPEVLRQATLKVAHAKHTEQKCTDCHARLVHPRQFQPALQAQLGTHAPKDCQVCHPSPAPAYLHGQANLQCDSCHSGTIPNHDLARKVGTMLREDCLECHNRLRVADPAACQVCHVSPHGIDQNCAACHASTKEWTEKAFAHPLALKGPHSRQQCTQCHGGSTFQAGKFNCASCHKLTHGPLGDNCTTCHKPDAWKPLRIDHAKAWNGYLGKHAAAACTACHATGQYKGTPTDCKACHRPPEKHFGDNCATCHKPEQPFKPPRQ
jgi:hypothetical protein